MRETSVSKQLRNGRKGAHRGRYRMLIEAGETYFTRRERNLKEQDRDIVVLPKTLV